MNWAFVDYENVGSLDALKMSDYERIFVFCGPKNTRIKVGALPTDGFYQLELIGVTSMGANNLDFHLAFHMGRFHEIAPKGVTFHVISNDTGFNGLVNHLKKLGRSCKKVTTRIVKPAQEALAPPLLSAEATMVLNRLKHLDGRKRPRKKASFVNWIKSQCPGCLDGEHLESVCQELVGANLVRESGADITYDI